MIPFDQLDAILFDLDGTLIDTDDAAVAKLAAMLRPVRWLFRGSNPAPFARRLTMQFETPGNGALTLLDQVHLDGIAFGASELLRKLRRKGPPDSFFPLEGVAGLLAGLAGRYRLALVTTRGRQDIADFCARHPGLAAHLEVLVGRSDSRRIKPHPAPLLLAADRLGVPIERCLMVGDTPVDVLAARRAGAWSIGVLCGFGERDELQAAGAHVVLEHTAQLESLTG